MFAHQNKKKNHHNKWLKYYIRFNDLLFAWVNQLKCSIIIIILVVIFVCFMWNIRFLCSISVKSKQDPFILRPCLIATFIHVFWVFVFSSYWQNWKEMSRLRCVMKSLVGFYLLKFILLLLLHTYFQSKTSKNRMETNTPCILNSGFD